MDGGRACIRGLRGAHAGCSRVDADLRQGCVAVCSGGPALSAGKAGVEGEAARKINSTRAVHKRDPPEGGSRDVAGGASTCAIWRRRAVRRLLSTSYILLVLSVLLRRRLERLWRFGDTFARGATSGDEEHGDYEGSCCDSLGDRFWLVLSVTTVTLLLAIMCLFGPHACELGASSAWPGFRTDIGLLCARRVVSVPRACAIATGACALTRP